MTPPPHIVAWIGSYTAEWDGRGTGVSSLVRDAAGLSIGPLRLPARSPSWLVPHPTLPLLYASEESEGCLAVFDTGEGLDRRDEVDGGAGACHIAVDPHARYLVSSAWADGRVILHELDAHGDVRHSVDLPPAVDPHLARRAAATRTASRIPGSHAHFAATLEGERFVTVDLGFDLLRIWRRTIDGAVLEQEIVLPLDSGPRHLARLLDGSLLVVTEYSNEIARVVRSRNGSYHLGQVTSISGADTSQSRASEIRVSPDGTRVYVALRGANEIATFAVSSGGLEHVDTIVTGGRNPRTFAIIGEQLVVANQDSDLLAVFAIDAASGAPTKQEQSIPIPSPAMIAAAQ